MRCREYRETLLDQFSVLDGKAESERIGAQERHRRDCKECARFASRLESTRELLEAPASRAAGPRPGFSARVVASLPETRSPLAWATVRLLPVTTALAVVLLGWCWLATPTPSELWAHAEADEVMTWVLAP